MSERTNIMNAMTAALDRFKEKYAGTLVGKCFVLSVIAVAQVGAFVVGILPIWFTSKMLGLESNAALVTAGLVGVVVAITFFYTWIMWLVDWRQRPTRPMQVLFEEYW
jgi:uncharacterized membrane protein